MSEEDLNEQESKMIEVAQVSNNNETIVFDNKTFRIYVTPQIRKDCSPYFYLSEGSPVSSKSKIRVSINSNLSTSPDIMQISNISDIPNKQKDWKGLTKIKEWLMIWLSSKTVDRRKTNHDTLVFIWSLENRDRENEVSDFYQDYESRYQLDISEEELLEEESKMIEMSQVSRSNEEISFGKQIFQVYSAPQIEKNEPPYFYLSEGSPISSQVMVKVRINSKLPTEPEIIEISGLANIDKNQKSWRGIEGLKKSLVNWLADKTSIRSITNHDAVILSYIQNNRGRESEINVFYQDKKMK